MATAVIESGKLIDSRLVQYWNAPKTVSGPPPRMDAKPPPPILVTESGMWMDVSPDPRNAPSPIVTTESGIEIDLKLELSKKV